MLYFGSSWPGTLFVLGFQLLLLVTLVPFTHATPPDPLWIGGIYDGADQDDVVAPLLDEELPLAHAIGTGVQGVAPSFRSLSSLAESPVKASAVATPRLRSPPSHFR